MSLTKRFFLSYSRQELYFAQAVTQTLQAAGLDVWFDLQQLEPGCQWQSEIAAGLEQSTDLLLIVSQSSLESPWVAKEWLHALAEGKPIHLLFFESAAFGQVTPKRGDPFDTSPLPSAAASIIDARRDFKGAMTRLIAALRGESVPREVIHSPNRFRLPQVMPLAVGYVGASLAFLSLFTLLISLVSLSAYFPLMLAGLLGAGIFAYQVWAFFRRESFVGARVSTLLGVILTLYFAFPLTPFYLVAVWLAFRSPDIHRWSPLGEGLAHGHGELSKAKRNHSTRPGEGWVLFLIPFMALVVIEPLLFIPGLILTFMTERRQRWGKLRRPVAEGEISHRFRMTCDAPDYALQTDIIRDMEGAGHVLALAKASTPPDVEIFVATNQTSDALLKNFKPAEGARVVVVLGSHIEDDKRFSAFDEYQWVDYRRHDPARLEAMAEDLRANHSESGNSYSTRTVPQNFAKILLPRPVAWYMAVQFFFFNLFFVSNTRTFLEGGRLGIVEVFSLIYGLVGVFVTAWMMNRVMRREITIPRMVRLGLGLIFVGSVMAFILSLATPLPRGMVRDSNALGTFLLANLIGLIAGYLYGKFYLRTVLGHWLPVGYSNVSGGFPAFKRDAALWRRNLIAAAFSVVLTMGFLGKETPVNLPNPPADSVIYERVQVQTLNLALPSHWLMSEVNPPRVDPYIWDVPISAILRRTAGPLNESTGVLINRALQGGLSQNFFVLLGEQLQVIFDRIQYSLSGEFDWNPDYYYGNALYSRIVTRNASPSSTVVMTVWHFAPTPANAFAPGWSVTTANSLAGTLRSGANNRGDMTYWESSRQTLESGIVVDEVIFSQRLETGRTVYYRVMVFDVRASDTDDYFVIFTGEKAALDSHKPVIDAIVASAQVK